LKIIIAGGGASGLMAAISAASGDARIIVLEGREKPAKKIYATGNGRCNFTNTLMGAEYYHSADLSLSMVKNALSQFGSGEAVNFFRSLGMLTKDRGGYLYPSTNQASTVAKVLEARCKELGVTIRCDTCVTGIEKKKDGFLVRCRRYYRQEKKIIRTEEENLQCDKVILAAGSTAGGFGCEVTGTVLAKKLGHHLIPSMPALTSLKCTEKTFWKQTAGVRIDAKITLFEQKQGHEVLLGEETGELQMVESGMSGIPVFQLSRHAAYALAEGSEVTAVINFLPDYDMEMLTQYITQIADSRKMRTAGEILSGIFPEKLAQAVLCELSIDKDKPLSKLSDKDRNKIVNILKNFRAHVADTGDMKNAQVCAGGVDTTELDADFQSKIIKDLYITGELLDVDGICGGYNLQFAWASGYLAGTAAGRGKE
jgi:hypothetical protein